MTLGEVITRIRAQCPGFAVVDHVLTSPATYLYPTALVGPVRDVANPPYINIPGGYAQDVSTTIGVYFVLERRQNGATGFSEADILDALRLSLRTALVNWAPSGVIEPLRYAGGQLAPFDGSGVVTWRDDYSTVFEMRFP